MLFKLTPRAARSSRNFAPNGVMISEIPWTTRAPGGVS